MVETPLRLALCLTAFLAGAAPEGSATLAAQAGGERKAPALDEQGYPVRLDGEVILRVKNALGLFTAEERARATETRIKRIADDPFYSEALFSSEQEGDEVRFYYREELVGMTTLEDATLHGMELEDYAALRIQQVQDAISSYRERRAPKRLLWSGIMLAVTTIIVVLLLIGLKRLHARVVRHAEEGEPSRLARMLKHRLGVPPQKIVEYRLRFVSLLRGFLTLLAALAWLQVTFSLVPMTRGYAFAVLRYLLDPLETLWVGFLERIGDLFFILVVLVLSYYLLKLMGWVAREARHGAISLPGVAPEFAVPLYKIARLVVIACAAMIIFPYIPGSSSAAFKGISLFAGALFTLGASGTAGNFIGGIVLVFMGHYRLGDRIRLGNVTGDVVEMNLLVTRVRTPKNELIAIPNSMILGGQLVNYSTRARHEGVILHTSVTIGYDTPWRQVHELLLEAARNTEGLLDRPTPFVMQTQLGDFCVSYELNASTRRPNEMARIYSDLHQNIQDAFNRAGVQIMSPHYVSDPAEPKVVPPARWSPLPPGTDEA